MLILLPNGRLGQQRGYRIQGPFTVVAGAVADLVLDVNACRSIMVVGASGLYLSKPVVNAVALVMSGAIAGTTVAGATTSVGAVTTLGFSLTP